LPFAHTAIGVFDVRLRQGLAAVLAAACTPVALALLGIVCYLVTVTTTD
jgi:hypothetical protein